MDRGGLHAAPITQPAVELIRWRVEHGRWPTLDDVSDVEGAVLIGRPDLTSSVFMPDDPAAWAMAVGPPGPILPRWGRGRTTIVQ
jgi:hypothetical protein